MQLNFNIMYCQLWRIWLLSLPLLLMVESGHKGGIYVDNGFDQTVQEFLSLEEQELMQEEILTLLGLTHSPNFKNGENQKTLNGGHRTNPIDESILNHTVPLFMLDIYNSLTMEDSLSVVKGELRDGEWIPVNNNRFQLSNTNVRAINDSDIIMSFSNHGRQDQFQWTQLFWFDTNELPRDPHADSILSAELRLYKQRLSEISDKGISPEELIKIKVYQLVEGTTGERHLLDSITVKANDEKWISLDVTEALLSWQRSYKTNQGLMVKILDSDDQQVHPDTVGIVGTRYSRPDQEGFMVAFLKHAEDPIQRNLRWKRELREEEENQGHHNHRRASRKKSKKRQRTWSNVEDDFGGVDDFYDRGGDRRNKRGCQMRSLFVSFKDLGWQEWIIAPEGYEAFYCQGECSFPLSNHMNATNHAIVQTLVHLMSHGVPKPCCAPTKLSGISVLYFDESTNVILKKFRKMVVKSCGCH